MGWDQDGTLVSTTLGDLLVHDGTSVVRFGVGADGLFLSADSGASEGVSWADPLDGHDGTGDPHPQYLLSANDVYSIEVAQVNSTTGELTFRWGIDSSGRPYFDTTEAVAVAEAARVYIGVDGRIYAEDLPL